MSVWKKLFGKGAAGGKGDGQGGGDDEVRQGDASDAADAETVNSNVIPMPSKDPVMAIRQHLAHLQREFDLVQPGLVARALGLLWASRHGLTKAELLRLTLDGQGADLPQERWDQLLAAFGDDSVDTNGVLSITSDPFRDAVEAEFVPDQEAKDELWLRLADEFESQPVTARSSDELAWLLYQAEACNRLRDCLLNIDRFVDIFQRDPNELLNYWNWLGDHGTMATSYMQSWEAWAGVSTSPTRVAQIGNQLAFHLHRAGLADGSEKLLRASLVYSEKTVGPDHPDVASTLNNLAVLYLSTERGPLAEPLSRRVVEIFLKATQAAKKPHPYLQGAITNYMALLGIRGLPPAEAMKELDLLLSPYGITVTAGVPPEESPEQ